MTGRGNVRNTAAHHHSAVAAATAINGATVIAWTVGQRGGRTVAVVAVQAWMLMLGRGVSSIAICSSQARSPVFDFVGGG